MPSTAATTHSITSPCGCCWGNLSIWRCASSIPQIPRWCFWYTSVWPTPALEMLCGCCFTTGMLKHLLCEANIKKKKYSAQQRRRRRMLRKGPKYRVAYVIDSFFLDVQTLWTQPWSRLWGSILHPPLRRVRPAALPSAPSSSFLMVSSRTQMKR